MDKAITAEELSELQQYNVMRGQLQSNLGLVSRKRKNLDREEEQLFAQLDGIDREEQMVVNRLSKKYDIPQNGQINLDTGAIST